MRHIVHFSGGLCSFWAAHRVIQRHGPENVTLLFADTYWEDPSLYIFNAQACQFLGVPITTLAEGRNPWQLFRDEKRIGSGLADICSRVLKRDLLDQWRKENTTPETAQFYLGMDWTEEHRMAGRWVTRKGKKVWKPGMREIFAPWKVFAPMMEEPIWDKDRMQRELPAGIALPRLYRLGFPHNNCGGFCVKAGQAHFAHLLKTMPHVYDINEREEEETRKIVGDYSVMKDRRGGGPRRTLTMRQFREEIEAGTRSDDGDWGGCGCSVDFEPEPEAVAS